MKTIFKILMLVALIQVFQSCATIVSGSKQSVRFNSEPKAATVYINEIEVGKTPVEKDLKRNQNYRVQIKMDGYQTYETTLAKKFNAWYVGNIAFGGVIGLIVDPITGAMYRLTPKELNSDMGNATTAKVEGNTVYIAVKLNIDPSWEKVGQMTKTTK